LVNNKKRYTDKYAADKMSRFRL